MKKLFINLTQLTLALVLTSAAAQTIEAKSVEYNVITEAKKYIQNPRVEVDCIGEGYDGYDVDYYTYTILNEIELHGNPKRPLPVLGLTRLLIVSQFNQETAKAGTVLVEKIQWLDDAQLSDKVSGDKYSKRFEIAVLKSESIKITVSKTQDLYSSVYCKIENLNPKFDDLAADETEGSLSPWNGKL